MSKGRFFWGQDHLTVSLAIKIANREVEGFLSDEVRQRVRTSSNQVEEIVENEETVYGINTGFGPLCTTKISSDQAERLQENILKSHAVGIGNPIDDQLVRLMLISKIHSLAKGYSGITLSTLERIIWHLENDLLPLVPEKGSVGASGDLAPLSHLFLPLIGLGKVKSKGKIVYTSEILEEQEIPAITLSAKEGLALINGTQFILAHAIWLVYKMKMLLDQEDLISAMMIEGLLASTKPFDQRIHAVRPYAGTQHTAAKMRLLLHESEIVHSHATCARVQDPYSLRCIPQVHGASREAWLQLKKMAEIELNGVTDNPLIFENGDTVSGGNFHGQPLALPIDYVATALSEIGNIADRRVYLSLEGDTPGVPKLLLKETGLNSGFMILQYTTAALASENKGLCFPSSADSIPTSLGQEDHVSMGSIGGRKALQILHNVEKIQAIELICAAQALDFHTPLKSGQIVDKLHKWVRQSIPHVTEDQLFSVWIERAEQWVSGGKLIDKANEIAEEKNISTNTEWSQDFDL